MGRACIALALALALALVMMTTAAAGAEKLPEGPGLAARYPGDRGIAKDPAVLFADDFESGDLANWDDKSGTLRRGRYGTDVLRRDPRGGGVGTSARRCAVSHDA